MPVTPKRSVTRVKSFTASVGKPGQARETREAVRAIMTIVNPTRKPPIAEPLDYEGFVSEKKSQLDSDSQRDLLLFPRDDIGESEVSEPSAEAQQALEDDESERAWLLTQEALKLYASSAKVIEFHYASFSGDYDTRADVLASDLNPLSFETDLVLEEERAALEGQVFSTSDVICEGFLFVVPESGILDNFKSAKKRYCIFKKEEDGKVSLELRKSPSVPPHRPLIPVKQVYLSKTKKGKSVFEVVSAEEEPHTFSFAADVDSDLSRWMFEVDRVLMSQRDDSGSITSCPSVAGTSAGDTESLHSEDDASGSSGGRESALLYRGKNAHVKALQPPIVERHNLFALYVDLDPLPEPRGEPCSLIKRLDNSRGKASGETRSDKHVVRFTVEFLKLDLKISVSSLPQQIEPFFVRLFLFDARAGKRISEEFRISSRFGTTESPQDDSVAESESSLEEDGLNGIPCSVLSDPNASKAGYCNSSSGFRLFMICSVAQPHRDVYVVARIERILSSDYSGDIYMKSNADIKAFAKQIKAITQASTRLSRFRMPFAWAARPAFQDMLGGGGKLSDETPLYKWDGNKMGDADLQKVLNDLAKSEKSGKLTIIPGATISLAVDISARVSEFPMRISPSYNAVVPWTVAPDTLISPCFEMQPFTDVASDPHTSLVNLLYVYPLLLKYDGQKIFNKARNIVCAVQFIASSVRGGASVKAIYDRFSTPTPFVQIVRCTVQHHEQNPTFGDEIKIQLPLTLDATDHLLFTFTHVSVASATQKSSDAIETPAGFAWLPLVKNDRLVMENDEQEVALPVAADLPDGYINYQSLGLGKGHVGPDVRWVEGGKPLFRVRLRLVSSVFTTEAKLQSFFQGCQKLQKVGLYGISSKRSSLVASDETGRPLSQNMNVDTELEKCNRYVSKKAQALLEVDIDRLIPFLPIVLGRLLSLLPACVSDDMAITVLTTLIGIVDRTMVAGRSALLCDFVKFQFRSTTVTMKDSEEEETTHSAICKYVSLLAANAQNDIDALAAIFRQLWFLLDVAIKSMAQRLLSVQLYKMPRKERYSAELLNRIRCYIEQTVPLLVSKHKEIPHETRIANTAIAYFLRCCLSFLDRGAVFSWIHFTVTKFDESDSRFLRDYKLDLLQILAGHEHWIPLALPVLCDPFGEPLRKDVSLAERNTSSSGITAGSRLFAKFLSKMLSFTFTEEQTTEVNPYLRFIDEYTLTEGYCSRHFLVGLLLQELQCSLREPRDYRKRSIGLVRNILAKHSIDKRYTDLRAQSRITTLYLPLLRLVLENLQEIEASLRTAEFVEQTSGIVPHPQYPTVGTSSRPAITSVGSPGVNIRPKRAASMERFAVPRLGGSLGSESLRSTVTLPPSISPPGQHTQIAGFTEKLEWGESRDLLLCCLFVLYRVPRKVFEALLTDAVNTGLPSLLDYLRLLELSLDFFKYRGLKFTLYRTSGKIRFTKRTMHVNLSTNSAGGSSTGALATVDSQTSSQASNSSGVSSLVPTAPVLLIDDEDSLPFSVLQESNLTQEIALRVLEIVQIIAQHVALHNKTNGEDDDNVFLRLLRLELTLLQEHWPDAVRLHTLAALAIFINLFRSRFFKSGPLDGLSILIEALLLQLNSRVMSVQSAAAALLHLILRNGYESSIESGKTENSSSSSWQLPYSGVIAQSDGTKVDLQSHSIECLGRPGPQTGVALARLLGQKASLAGSVRFGKGLSVLESFVNSVVANRSSEFDSAVTELIFQLRGVLAATGALAAAVNNPIRVADLHIQLADSYRGSAALRSAWFDTLAETHMRDRWYAEAAVCEAHVLAIMAKELSTAELATFDWNLFTPLNDSVVKEENVCNDQIESVEKAGFTLRNFTSKVEKTIQTLVLAERYEAIGPICRLAIPIYEKLKDYRALVSMYVDLQQAYSLADQVKITGKRHLGAYFRVFFYSSTNFGEEHNTEWVYREPGLTSLAEAYERMTRACQLALGHSKVQVVPEKELDESKLDKDFAYIQMTHVEPAGGDGTDLTSFEAHTNARRFMYECNDVDKTVPIEAPSLARQALRKVYLTTVAPFPNTCRRQRVTGREEVFMNPLELAVDKLLYKAEQIRRILETAATTDGTKKSLLARVDIKGLQLLLQGAVQPTVNVGPLAYAEAFTAPAQKERYGEEGVGRLADAFRKLMTYCADALQINEAAISSDQAEYQQMLKNAFVAMMERLNSFFGDAMSMNGPKLTKAAPAASAGTPQSSMHVLDSIGGVNP